LFAVGIGREAYVARLEEVVQRSGISVLRELVTRWDGTPPARIVEGVVEVRHDGGRLRTTWLAMGEALAIREGWDRYEVSAPSDMVMSIVPEDVDAALPGLETSVGLQFAWRHRSLSVVPITRLHRRLESLVRDYRAERDDLGERAPAALLRRLEWLESGTRALEFCREHHLALSASWAGA
jgi:hypothetical protein